MKIFNKILAVLLILVLMLPASAVEKNTVRIGIVDTGISIQAIDFEKIESGKNYAIPGASWIDSIGHGTAVASIIVGSESAGITGVCPEATLIPLVMSTRDENRRKVSCSVTDLATIVYDAVDIYHCDIINLSLTTRTNSPELQKAVNYAWEKGVLVVASIGNDGTATVYYPGGFDSVLCVGSVSQDGTNKASFSNHNRNLDILAPGEEITISQINGKATTGSGTSYSTAYISGIVANLMLAYPELTAEQIVQIILASATDLGDVGYDNQTGWGVMNTEKTLSYAAQGRQFRDVAADQWYFEGVKFMSTQGLMKGTDAVNFSPNQTTTRAMMWVMLHRMDGQSDTGGENWYSNAQNWVKEHNIADGKSPDQVITREEIATMLYQYSKYKGRDVSTSADLSSYSDASTVSKNAAEAMKWACGSGIINGMDGALNPQGSATRAQIATMLMRFAKL